MKINLLTGILFFAFSSLLYAQSKPNIVFILADDMGYGDVAAYGCEDIQTENLDRLAASGVRYTSGYSSHPYCSPMRAALMAGRYQHRFGYERNIAFDQHNMVMGIPKSEKTVASRMQEAGYATAAIGKWHLGWDWDALRKEPVKQGEKKPIEFDAFDWSRSIPDGPLAHGFDHYFGDTVINFPPYCWIEDDRVVKAPDTMMDTDKWKAIKEGRWECRPGPMASDWDPYQNIPTTTKRAVEYIEAQAKTNKPFFLYFALPSPHAPIIPNDVFDGRSQAGPYGDFVVESDDACGQLIEALKRTDEWENTVVLFSADNGPEKYAYERDQKFDHWSAKPFRGLKRDIYEGGHHVPFLIRWPGVTKPGAVSDALVSQIDFMATVADAIGYELPNDQAEDSHNLMPLLKGETGSVRSTHVHNTRTNQYAIRDGDWVLVAHKDGYMSGRNDAWEAKHNYSADDGQAVELYNLAEDIGQRRNLVAANPERVEFMQALLDRIRKQGYSAPRLVEE